MKSKRLLALLLTSAMTASMILAGCGGGNTDGGSGTDTGSASGSEASGTDASGEDSGSEGVSTEIDMEEEPYTVAIQVVTLPGSDYSAGEAAREEAINALTVPAINCKVDIQEVWISEIANTTSMAVAGNEKVDIIHVATVNPLSSLVGSDILYDMNTDNLLQNRGPALVELFGDELEAGNVDGKQLAIPAKTFNATGKGIFYNKTMADELGITVPETMTFEELSDILYQVHEANPDVMCYYSGAGTNNYLFWLQSYETFGTDSSYGIILNASEDPTVVNMYETDMFKDYCLQTFHWTQDGIQPGDPTDTNTAQDYFNAQNLFCCVASINPEQEASWGSNAASAGFEIGSSMLVEPTITNSGITEYMWGIATNCERPDKAMDFLNFLYTNAEVANILKYGLEGDNYDFVEGSDKVVALNGTYDPMFYYGGNESDMYIKFPAGEDYIDQMQAMEDEATVSPLAGYMFDDTAFQTESSVISSTIQEYLPRLQNGMCESEEETLALIDEFNERLKAAGIEDVIAANQEQVDAYLSSHSTDTAEQSDAAADTAAPETTAE